MTNKNAIGIVELTSIAKGYLVQDAMFKASNVEKLISRTICPGKYFIAVRGDVADIENAIEVANEVAAYSMVNSTIIPNIDPKVFPAITGSTVVETTNGGVGALLVMETFSVVSAIKAADFAVKEADIELMRIQVAMAIGGKGLIVMSGEIGALEAAIQPALEYIKKDGLLADYSIIKNPHEDVLKELI